MYLKILLLSICFAGTICPSFAQQKDVIDILHADTYAVNMKSNIDSLLGNVRLKHKNMLMFCDKLYNHRDSNYVEAFGNVHVIQNDTLNLWGDFMLYNGNTEFAKVRDNVIMKDPKITRALTKILREKGTMNGMITTNNNYNIEEIIPRLKAYTTGNVVDKVTCSEKRVLKGNGKRVALLDLGAKNNIAQSLNKRGCEVTIYPAHTTAEEILATNPDGIMLSNGPGDPKECKEIIAEIKKLYDSDTPIFAICLGHQLMALATGADTHKMKYGHRGGNHPVKDLETGRVYISSQNHGYVVDTDTLDPVIAKPAFVNVNDGTNEGLSYVGKNIFTVQFHPEACPGPQDSAYLFDRFISMM